MNAKNAFRLFWFASTAIFLSGIASVAAAQDNSAWTAAKACEIDSTSHETQLEANAPLEASYENSAPAKTQGLTPVEFGTIVYDSNQGVCWLADANLAGNPEIREAVKLSIVNPDGSAPSISPDGNMDYETALNWVNSLNTFNQGRGWRNHHNWQLPNTPLIDTTCSSVNNGNFGASCTNSALGNLYKLGLKISNPDSVVRHFVNRVWPFQNLHPGYYWTADSNNNGEVTMSFLNAVQASNTTKYNYMHVLPMTTVPIGEPPYCPAGFTGVMPYRHGPAAGKAVYDCNVLNRNTWVLDANLAATENFGITGTTTIIPDVNTSPTLTVPLIDGDGTMLFNTANDPTSGWVEAMNDAHYAGTNLWKIPYLADLQALFQDLNLQKNGDFRLVAEDRVGPFWNLQPFFYWSCERDPGSSQSPCNNKFAPPLPGPPFFGYSFNFDDGFEGTSLIDKQFYVMVYYPATTSH